MAGRLMEQTEFTGIFCERPRNFAWFLGAGASRSAGLPTAADIIWDLKRRHYRKEENQDVSPQDIQNDAVKDRIQAFMDAHGFPPPGSDDEYATYFQKIFGDDKERQRRYLRAILSEDRVRLSVGNRVFGALISAGFCRVGFTTNFDSVVEKAVAEVGGSSLAAYHLEGSHAIKHALNNEEYPVYCKLHGDFRYDSLKNLPDDLARQNADLAEGLVIAAARFGFVVTGYSGRDKSVIDLFRQSLSQNNPFPHGLFWTGIKGFPVPAAVSSLLDFARNKGVAAAYVPIETCDALLLRLWRNLDDKPANLDAKIRRTQATSAHIPLPAAGRQKPLLRLNAIPVAEMPTHCLSLTFKKDKGWDDLRTATRDSKHKLFLTKGDSVYGWGTRHELKVAFGDDLVATAAHDFPVNLLTPENLHFKGLAEEALVAAMARGKPLLSRGKRSSSYLIVDPHAADKSYLTLLERIVGKMSGTVANLFTIETPDYPKAEPVSWAEALSVSIELRANRYWVLLDPEIWIWPQRAREIATEFLDDRQADRFNAKHNSLLDAWITIILGTTERKADVTLSTLDGGTTAENPAFRVGTRTAFSKKLA